MSKAVLVLDIPESCERCYFHECHYSLPLSTGRKGYICHYDKERRMMDLDYDEDTYKPNWCPLRPVPEKIGDMYKPGEYTQGRIDGYNACIDEIMGGKQ